MGNRDEHCRIRPHRDTVMAVWEAYRGGELAETDGPIVPETSPFRPKPRRTDKVAIRMEAPEAAVGQAAQADRY
jgi:hypothetical protein